MKFEIFNLTDKLLNENTINNDYFSQFYGDGKYFARFNPGLCHLKENLFLMSYRIWIDKYSHLSRKYPNPIENGSPWNSWWNPIDLNDILNSSSGKIINSNLLSSIPTLNFFGLAVIKIDEKISVIHDQICISDNSYVEDGRIFKDSNNIIKIIYTAVNKNINESVLFLNSHSEPYKNRRFMCTNEIGSVDKILSEISDINNENIDLLNKNNFFKFNPKKIITIGKSIIMSPILHKNYNRIEKNWICWKDKNNKDYISDFRIPIGSSIIHTPVITYNDQNEWKHYNDPNVSEHLKYLIRSNDNNVFINLVDNNKSITENIYLFDKINEYYGNCVRFSGGTNAIKFDDNSNIAVGHINIHIQKFKKLFKSNLLTTDILDIQNKFNLSYEQSHNIYSNINNFLNRPIENGSDNKYTHHHSSRVYMMFFYTFNSSYPFNIIKISHCFTPPFVKFNTGVVFPTGIEIINNNLYVSYGESDNLICIFKTDSYDLVNYLHNIDIHPADYKFIEYN